MFRRQLTVSHLFAPIRAHASFSPVSHFLPLIEKQTRGSIDNLTAQDRDTLSPLLISSLRDLQNEGLKIEHLRSWETTFTYSHHLALVNLIRKRCMTPDHASLALQGLNEDQLLGIAQGLTPDQVIGLTAHPISVLIEFKDSQPRLARDEIKGLSHDALSALKTLKNDGLRGEHLRYWQDKLFTCAHHLTLFSLIRKYQLTPAQATEEMKAYPLLPQLHEKKLNEQMFFLFKKATAVHAESKENDTLETLYQSSLSL